MSKRRPSWQIRPQGDVYPLPLHPSVLWDLLRGSRNWENLFEVILFAILSDLNDVVYQSLCYYSFSFRAVDLLDPLDTNGLVQTGAVPVQAGTDHHEKLRTSMDFYTSITLETRGKTNSRVLRSLIWGDNKSELAGRQY